MGYIDLVRLYISPGIPGGYTLISSLLLLLCVIEMTEVCVCVCVCVFICKFVRVGVLACVQASKHVSLLL